jgi:hypothetical protein
VQAVLSPDDKTIAAQVGDSVNLFSLTGGPPRRALGLSADDYLSRWSPDGRELWVYGELSSVMRVDRVDPQTGKRSLLTQITPSDPAGLREAVGSGSPMIPVSTPIARLATRRLCSSSRAPDEPPRCA